MFEGIGGFQQNGNQIMQEKIQQLVKSGKLFQEFQNTTELSSNIVGRELTAAELNKQ